MPVISADELNDEDLWLFSQESASVFSTCLSLPPQLIGKGPLGPDVSKCAGSGYLIRAPSGNSYYWLDWDHIIQERNQ